MPGSNLTPPLNGSYRQWLQWVLALVIGFSVCMMWLGASRIINHELRIQNLEVIQSAIMVRLTEILNEVRK